MWIPINLGNRSRSFSENCGFRVAQDKIQVPKKHIKHKEMTPKIGPETPPPLDPETPPPPKILYALYFLGKMTPPSWTPSLTPSEIL